MMINNCSVEYDILISKVHRWGEIIRFGGNLSTEDIEDDVRNILELIKEERNTFILKVFSKKEHPDVLSYEIESVDICILALVVGIDLKLADSDLLILGVSCLLKDLGMNKIPSEILNKKEDLLEDEIHEIKNHPDYSIEIIGELGFGQNIKDVVIDHHERWDGKGYPRGKSQENINYMARVISVIDGFNAMKEDRPYRESLEGYGAIKSIIGDNGQRYDPTILNVVVKSIGIYPIGSYVALNDASICQVISINKDKPLKPVVKVIINKDGTESKSNSVVDISDNNRFFVVKSVLVK